nr:hypothetical protein [Microbacterium bovistercoris]
MARGDIVIPISSETKAFKQGVEAGIIKPLDDAEKALDDLGKTHGPTDLARDLDKVDDKLDDLGRNRGPDKFEDAMRDAQKATDKLGDEVKDTARDIEQQFRDSYRSAERSSGDSFSKMREHGQEAGSELRQNFGETVSSFRGDMEDIPDLLQGTFGGLATSLGPVGAIGAGIIGALIGVGTQMVQNWQGDTDKMKEAGAEWADAYIEAGGRVLTFEQQAAKVRGILTDAEQYKAAEEKAKQWGVDILVAAEALSGSATAIQEVKDSYSEMAGKADEMKDKFLTGKIDAGQLSQWKLDVDNGKKSLEELTGQMELGQQAADVYSRFLRDVANTTQGATREVDKFGDTIVTLPDGHKIYIDAETGQATEDVDAIEKHVYGLKDKTVKVTARVNVDDTALRRYRPAPISVPALVKSPTRNWVID